MTTKDKCTLNTARSDDLLDKADCLADKITGLVSQRQYGDLPAYLKLTAISDAYRSEVNCESTSDVDDALIMAIIEFLGTAKSNGVKTALITRFANAVSENRLNAECPACDKTKRFVVEVWGEEVIRHRRNIIVEVPFDLTKNEVEELEMSFFDDVPEPPEWELEESDGIWGCDEIEIKVIDDACPIDTSDVCLHRDAEGKLAIIPR